MKEIWKDIKGYEELYQVSSLGRVKSLKRIILRKNNIIQTIKKRILKQYYNKKYKTQSLSISGIVKSYLTHRLIAFTFINNPLKKRCVNHIDGNYENNNINNLEWCTHSENLYHAYKIGIKKHIGLRGEHHAMHKLTDADVLNIRNAKKIGINNNKLCKKYNVCRSTIIRAYNGRNWTHI
jgi:hypothetical protein